MKVESPQESSIAEIDLALGGLHRHVAHAWFLTREHADPSPITAPHLLTAAAALAPLAPKSDPAQRLGSQPAFAAWATLLGSLASEIREPFLATIGAKSIERWDERIARGGSETFLVMEELKRVVDAALPFIFKAARARGDQRPLMWGRDLVAIGLLAAGDPTARKVAEAAGSSLEALQDRWFDFMTADANPDLVREIKVFWHAAGVLTPDERAAAATGGDPSADKSDAPAEPPRPAARRRVIDTAWHPLASGHPPAWASAWGQDKFGVYVEFTIDAVSQRLRWIPPGRFLMGSPETEAGRFDGEGSQHEVTVVSGFWLFDTPCTQALWEAVMGDNPSEFKSRKRPVAQVSWNDVQGFLQRINARVPGLDLVMPSEAQWEYACRAGTKTATYAGNLEILGERNAPVLDAIAWYGGNSGVGFELENGWDSSDWAEKQYEHTRAGTGPVAAKDANPWGLYDMLGNVWEWCADHWHGDYQDAPNDGSAWINASAESSADRVVRGGSWRVKARFCRAAFRNGHVPVGRFSFLGFRPARGQA